MLVTMTRFLFSLTYGKELTAVNMQVAKQQVSVKGANNSPFLNELNPFFSCYGMPVLVSDMEDIWQTLILSRNWKLHPFLLYIKAAENTKLQAQTVYIFNNCSYPWGGDTSLLQWLLWIAPSGLIKLNWTILGNLFQPELSDQNLSNPLFHSGDGKCSASCTMQAASETLAMCKTLKGLKQQFQFSISSSHSDG